jgi:hypothetical protein
MQDFVLYESILVDKVLNRSRKWSRMREEEVEIDFDLMFYVGTSSYECILIFWADFHSDM